MKFVKNTRYINNSDFIFIDIILGLAIDGDDYITRPFSPKEISYRVKAQLLRAS